MSHSSLRAWDVKCVFNSSRRTRREEVHEGSLFFCKRSSSFFKHGFDSSAKNLVTFVSSCLRVLRDELNYRSKECELWLV